MIKYFLIAIMAALPLIAITPAQAAIIDSGTTTFDFFSGSESSTTVD